MKIFYALLLSLLLILVGLLSYEYSFFKRRREELTLLKEDYQEYVAMLKRQLDELEIIKNSGEFQKKKSNYVNDCFPKDVIVYSSDTFCQEEQFTLINRQAKYLEEATLHYIHTQGFQEDFLNLYNEIRQTETGVSNSKLLMPVIKKREKKKSLHTHKQFNFTIRWPLNKSQFWLSSFFGPRKKVDGSWGFHYGLDLAALKGTPVYAAAGGKVVEASYAPHGYGKFIVIMHDKKYKTRYAHLDKILVRVGQQVAVGQLIGNVGNTGLVRGKNASHLHLEVMVYGKRINPLHVLQ